MNDPNRQSTNVWSKGHGNNFFIDSTSRAAGARPRCAHNANSLAGLGTTFGT